jgi:hypothetical protein
VAADKGRELGGGGLPGGQAGDGVDGFGAPFLLVEFAGAAGELDGLEGVREQDPGRDGDGFEGAFLHPAMTPASAGVSDRDLCPGQDLELLA